MPRYIDADRFEVVTSQRHSEDFIDGMDYILEMIDNAPTADVVPRSAYEQIQAEKDNLIATYEACMKTYAEQLFEEIEDIAVMCYHDGLLTEKQAIDKILELKKKHIGDRK